ncbi:NADH dehydrogenase [ubiquinone] 1 beta subcomplex subunit 10 [Anthonomus grandis grandis]|uniref:NADH dehydrogenase [ubiquinone] 1 beta subcomplex subunit 10 n=1 Tax=Anthonomus grandis grandis TaxID=2921223 RepID=UPI002166609E|nr:NADH dehydrogenase [ubiquinone] 1 beta subcomplex subunit 10 [Anthonomus grandis grandis]
MPENEARNTFEAFFFALGRAIDGPTTWFKEKVVEPNQKQYPWYHQKFRRVPTIDECYTDDVVCVYEANAQYRRDRLVDTEIVAILRDRLEACVMYERPDHKLKCQEVSRQYEEAAANWFCKYGDLGAYHDAKKAFMKQKHRMIWERRHGPVGSGMKQKEQEE